MSFPILPGRLARVGRRLEAILGFVTEFLIVSLAVCGCVGALAGGLEWAAAGRAEQVLLPVIFAIVMVALVYEAVFVCRFYDALRVDRLDPFVPLFALRFRPWRPLFRPVAVCWWLGHFAIAAGLAFGTEAAAAHVAAGAGLFGRWGWVVRPVVFAGVGFPFTFASNLYASMALVAAGLGEPAVATAWRWRLTLDFTVAAAAAVTAALAGYPHGY